MEGRGDVLWGSAGIPSMDFGVSAPETWPHRPCLLSRVYFRILPLGQLLLIALAVEFRTTQNWDLFGFPATSFLSWRLRTLD
jgi:hypothetical protein